MGQEPRRLSETYYLDNFHYMLNHVERLYLNLLTPLEMQFLTDFRGLSTDSQCLYVRMANRKGRYFRVPKLEYPEIKDTGSAWQQLQETGFIFSPEISDEWEAFDLLRLFTVKELSQVLKEFGPVKQMGREEVLLRLFQLLSITEIGNRFVELGSVAEQGMVLPLDMIRLFFFGHPYGDMSQFVVRDIGHARFEAYDEAQFKPQFRNYQEVSQLYYLYQHYKKLKRALLMEDGEQIDGVVDELVISREDLSPASEAILRKFVMRAGKWYESSGLPEKAVAVYGIHSLPDTRERLVRVLKSTGRTEIAREVLAKIASEPETHAEWLFASDQLVKLDGGRQVLTTTKVLKESPELLVPKPDGSLKIEEHVLRALRESGFEGVHTENYLWRSLFGLIFWEELYSQERALIHQPLQRVPADLQDRRYFRGRLEAFEFFGKNFTMKNQLFQKVMITLQAKEGILNPWVGWHPGLPLHLETLFQYLDLDQLLAMSLEIARNPLENGTGLPDLFVWKGEEYHFWEIKSPTDHLSAHQVFWINFMKERGIRAEVLRVKYL